MKTFTLFFITRADHSELYLVFIITSFDHKDLVTTLNTPHLLTPFPSKASYDNNNNVDLSVPWSWDVMLLLEFQQQLRLCESDQMSNESD